MQPRHTGEPLLEYDGTGAAAEEGKHDRSSVIGLTAAGERVHGKTDEFGVSAAVQWNSPVEYVFCMCSFFADLSAGSIELRSD